MTGSVVLPIKAVIMNALSLSAMFGILVLIFQDGNLAGLLGYHSLGALDATQPILLFAVGFGLATDYGVFLLSRIKEARDGGASDSEAVAIGLERTGRDRHRRSAAVRGRDRGVRDLEDRVHQGARARRGAGRADRRLDHPRAAGPVADGAARPAATGGRRDRCAGCTTGSDCARAAPAADLGPSSPRSAHAVLH